MESDDNINWNVIIDQPEDEIYEYDPKDFKITFADLNISYDNDSTYGVTPVEDNPEIYTSHKQRERHEKYPVLQKAWEEYLNMYNLTHGEPPNVD